MFPGSSVRQRWPNNRMEVVSLQQTVRGGLWGGDVAAVLLALTRRWKVRKTRAGLSKREASLLFFPVFSRLPRRPERAYIVEIRLSDISWVAYVADVSLVQLMELDTVLIKVHWVRLQETCLSVWQWTPSRWLLALSLMLTPGADCSPHFTCAPSFLEACLQKHAGQRG